ncbi:MAG: transporter substrate-binding domain-containing protein [Chlamydiae bacterium]|nr:transporter substrate-binding domain-containing protein [Chlamydiota bacterium]
MNSISYLGIVAIMRNYFFRLLAPLLLAVLCLLGHTAISGKEKPLVIGMELSNPPFETVDTSGTPFGVSVDIAKELGLWLGRDITIKNIPFVGLIPSLKAKKIDIILSSMTPTFQREESIAFSNAYLSIGLCLLINKEVKGSDAKELNQKTYKIVVKTGTTGQQYARRIFPDAEILALEQASSCITEVLQGKASAFLYDQLSVLANWQKYPEKTKVNLTPLVTDNWAIGLRKEDVALKDSINIFLSEFTKRGGFETLKKKYLENPEEIFKEMGIPLIFSPQSKEPLSGA